MQETQLWLNDRFGRLELIAEHSEEVLANALKLVQGELQAIRDARAELNI